MDTSIIAVHSSQMEHPRCPCGEFATCAFSYDSQASQYACRAHDPTLQPTWQHFRPPNFSYTTRVLPVVGWGGAGGASGFSGSWVATTAGGGGGSSDGGGRGGGNVHYYGTGGSGNS